jgi:hypothetical protein
MPEVKRAIVVPTVPPNSDNIVLMDGDIPVYLRKSAVDGFHGVEHTTPTGLPERFRVLVRGGFSFLVTAGPVAEEQLLNALARSAWPPPDVTP